MKKGMMGDKVKMPDYRAKVVSPMRKAPSGNKIKEAHPAIKTLGRDDKSKGNGYMRGCKS